MTICCRLSLSELFFIKTKFNGHQLIYNEQTKGGKGRHECQTLCVSLGCILSYAPKNKRAQRNTETEGLMGIIHFRIPQWGVSETNKEEGKETGACATVTETETDRGG